MSKKAKETHLVHAGKTSLGGKIFRLLTVLMCAGIIYAVYMMLQPQSLVDIDGHDLSGGSTRNLHEVLTKAVGGNYSVTVTEAEINHLLANELVAKQGGLLQREASLKRVLVRLKKNLAEVIIVREVLGYEMTVSMYLQIQQIEDKNGIKTKIHLHGGNYEKRSVLPNIGGRFGKLSVPQGFLNAVVPDYIKIARVMEPEIDLGFQKMARFEIQDKRLILDPRRPTRHVGGEDASF
jgi:hypothetical protein